MFCYDVHGDGALGEKQVFARTERGVPDGLAVAMDGSVWIALAGGGHGVVVYDAAGIEQRFFETPEPMCTSLCFGGPDLQQLFAVTGSDGTDSDRSGCVYVMDCDVAGVPVPQSKVALG